MAAKNKTIKNAVKLLRALLLDLKKNQKSEPVIKSLVVSLIKGISIPFNKTIPNAVFNKRLVVRSSARGGFNKVVYAKFNKIIAPVIFNKTVR